MASLTETTDQRSRVALSLTLAATIIGIVTVIRLIGLKFSVVDLFFDEAQYWAWSREPAFGYFSKPPLLAWTIGLAERFCGSSEACIRAPAPLFYFGTSLLVYAVARQFYSIQVSFFAALSLALATGTVFSARIISTDVPLLFFWALALLAYVKLLAGGGWRWTVVLGLALGLGLMAKYAMIYFVFGIAIAAVLDRDARMMLRSPMLWLALPIALVMIAPNILWNLHNGLATFRATGQNIHGTGVELSLRNGFEFLAAQFGVFGPIVFAVLLLAIARIGSRDTPRADRLMLAFALPPLVLVAATGFVTKANANWAAPAFVSATVVAVAILIRRGAWRWLAASLAIGIVLQALFLIGDAMATRITIPGVANGDLYRRTLGWRVLGERTGEIARRIGARTIVAESRDIEASLMYYLRDRPEQVLAWPHGAIPDHQFDITRALTDAAPLPILFISHCTLTGRLKAQFYVVEPLGDFSVPTGPTSTRSYFAIKLDDKRGPIRPLGGCSD
jgi:4-amino-4-deoxy-L-arabinose transferase-like glycosyltransferase